MPNTKEKGKLIELLSKHIPYGYATLCLIAEELMAEGVTVQGDKDINIPTKWISVKDRLPEKCGHYLCNYHFGEYPKMTFTQVLDYYAKDIVPHFQHTLGDGSMKVTHWMEIPKLPQPPKGE